MPRRRTLEKQAERRRTSAGGSAHVDTQLIPSSCKSNDHALIHDRIHVIDSDPGPALDSELCLDPSS
ncbi:hypothetical protein EVAR_51147_1 [Eumeta japonica]|uniref:Uncharacterized protein n=1 Tax=Eumeta variegata TaxID=151549 RepID=A0A4C1YP35_EUMVA|nr:hypothetical protein EVAR_51147_1 [Eumeta japonica]